MALFARSEPETRKVSEEREEEARKLFSGPVSFRLSAPTSNTFSSWVRPGVTEAPCDVVKRWRMLIDRYLRGRAVLRRALVLVDARHGLKDIDREIMTMLDAAAVSYHLVLTKADKVKPTALAALIERIAAEARSHSAAHPDILATSAETGAGIAQLRAAVVEATL
jgi:GTP-binding protein EngB required for normal cell division